MPSGLEQNAINKSHLLKRTAMAAQGLKDYLQRYVDKSEVDGGKAKSKKKKKRKGKGPGGSGGGNAGQGVIIVDDDAVWHRERNAEEDEDEPDEEGEGPTVIEDVEVKRMHRMEAMKTHRPYLSMANDGSGWVTVKNDEGSPEAAAGGEAAVRLGGDENSVPRSPQGKSLDLSKRKRHYSPDLSPPRRRNDSPDEAPGRSEPSEDFSSLGRAKSFTVGDLSPPRRRKDLPDLSPPRRRHDSPPDESPSLPTKRRRMDSSDLSPPRRRKGSADVPLGRKVSSQDLERSRRSEFSPGGAKLESRDSSLRKRRALDRSPPRRRHDSPPRKRNESPDLSPPRRRKGSADSSPPRTSKFSTGDPQLTRRNFLDQHAPRGRHESPDDLPSASSRRPGAARNWNEAQDLSPPRRNRDSPDLPPARKGISEGSSSPRKQKSLMSSPNQNRTEESSPSRKKGSGRMADGTFAGLKSDRDVVSAAERKRAAEAKMLSELDPSLSGRGAETVFRDKRGRRLEGLEEMLRQQRGEAKPAEQPLEWGKGLAQKKVAEANVAELEAEKSKPFARYRDDPELDKSLKERLRWGDPMAHLVKKKAVEPVLEDLGAREEMKASGFIVPQDIPKHSWLKRGIAPPPNRYDIRPGRHWDGVDRSTGFEQGLFKQKNEKKARDLEAYLWSVSDM